MKTGTLHICTTLRFRRWGRAGYSVFCSINRVVTIGQLAVALADKAILKLNNRIIETVDLLVGSKLEDIFEKLKAENNFISQNIFQMEILRAATVCNSGKTIAKPFYCFSIQAIGMRKNHFSRLFYIS
ncbi:MAG: hypothetical protein LBS50_05785 [Prevotellaceae bacterium]|jgi:hypothetical protein|nr:hypothetical protein [Prevotellaceae bacterium]